ncbi:MAG: SDR family oxidoreductase [Halobacteriaceae archaeon]
MPKELEGNVALVAASSSGLGKASAESLAQRGANVVINGRDEDRLEKTRAALQSEYDQKILSVQGDLTVKDDITNLVETTIDEFGQLDHLVTNAGGPPSGKFLETTDEEWYHTFDLLVMSVVRLVRSSVPYLREGNGGTIVTITSRSVKEAIDSLVLSNAVRMSVIGLEKTLSKELGPDIRANAVLPGSHETARTEELIQAAIDRGEIESYQEGLDARSEDVPLDRIGYPSELGEVVAFLSSPKSSYVNGVAIEVDGGSGHSNL